MSKHPITSPNGLLVTTQDTFRGLGSMGCSCEHFNQIQLIIGGPFKYGFKKWACTACNKVASALATKALSSTYERVWLEDCCRFITSFVSSDMNKKSLIVSFKKIIIKGQNLHTVSYVLYIRFLA